jgi:hypothetical protein
MLRIDYRARMRLRSDGQAFPWCTGAVLARESPGTATDDVTMLNALEFAATDDPLVLRRGVELAIELKQHLFDTYYHAVALETPDSTLMKADERYLRAARKKGRIVYLMEWDG